MNDHGTLTKVFRHPLRDTCVCITSALEPCRLVDSALGKIAVPAGIEIILIRALSVVAVSITSSSRAQITGDSQRAGPGRSQCIDSDPGERRLHLDGRRR